MRSLKQFIRLLRTAPRGAPAVERWAEPVTVVLAASSREGLEDVALELADALADRRGRPPGPDEVADLAAWLSDHGDAHDRPHLRVEVSGASPAELAARLVALATTGDAPGVRRAGIAPVTA